jgi:ligand-binding sensor domain-containing protein/DNA-binding CsgD family transcriptional regulator
MASTRKYIKKLVLLFIVIILGAGVCPAQETISRNEIKSYIRNQYGGGTQNWAMAQDKNNRIYIANNEGLLVFDGTNWQVFPVPNKTILRSIGFGPDGKLYAGAQDELGFFAPDAVGRLQFTSLKNSLPDNEKKFPDVWELEVAGDEVFFRTNTRIFKLTGEKFTIYPAQSTWLSLHKYRGQMLAHDKNNGLYIYQNGDWQSFIQKDLLPANFFITDVMPYKKDTSLLSTISNGLFLLTQNKLIPFAIKTAGFSSFQHFTSLSLLNDTSFLAGTYFNGAYRITRQGQVLENISIKNGMPNNTVRCLYTDNNGDAWMALDNGVAFFAFNSAIKHINPPAFNNGAGYGVKALHGNLYFALSTGLQYLPIKSISNISSIPDDPKIIMGGLTWNLSIVNNQLVAGRDDGLYKINNYQASPLSQATGYWTCKPIPNTSPLEFVAGSYLGVQFYRADKEKFIDIGSVEKFTESSRYVETENNTVWISHPYRGIYKINIANKAITLFNQKDGLPADLDNHVFKIKNKIVFGTTKGIYEYNEAGGKMVVAKTYAELFGERPLRFLREDAKGNIWFVQDKMLGVADYSGSKPVIHYIPELKNKILSGFEDIFPYDLKNVLVGGETGFYHINYEKYRENIKPFTTYITQVKTLGARDSVLFGGYMFNNDESQKKIAIPYKWNSIQFAYAASVFGQHSNLEFSYYLNGFDNNWSSWSNKSYKDYTNLPAGTYTFNVKARSSPSHESVVYQYTFTIKPPWSRTVWAYALYLLVFIALLFTLLKYQARKHNQKQEAGRLADQQQFEEEQKQIAYQHQIELEKSEKELIRLRNEKLEGEIEHKNAELASATMNLVQKKEFILKLKAELQQLQKTAKVGDDSPELKKLLKVLSEEEKLNEEWEHFSQHFNSVHGDFLTILKNKFPSLKPHELRLCAYLRMNLSSKEIAPLMSISIRGVEISRYRLRKKLPLSTEDNLVQYLLDLQLKK